jgi:hypothetical protein
VTARRSAVARAAGTLLALSGATAVLVAAGHSLPAPPTVPADLLSWWRSHDPVVAAVALLRVGALVLVAHLALVSGVAAVGAVVRSPTLVARARRAGPRTWAHWLRPLAVVAAVSTAPHVGVAAPAAAVVSADPDPLPDRMRRLPDAADSPWRLTLVDPGDAPIVPEESHGATTTSDVDTAAVATTAGWRTVTAAPGDNLWSLAEHRLTEALGRTPTGAEVVPYWRDVIAANATTHPDPDLVLVGDAIRLPPPPG